MGKPARDAVEEIPNFSLRNTRLTFDTRSFDISCSLPLKVSIP